jgi:hypothetical protein
VSNRTVALAALAHGVAVNGRSIMAQEGAVLGKDAARRRSRSGDGRSGRWLAPASRKRAESEGRNSTWRGRGGAHGGRPAAASSDATASQRAAAAATANADHFGHRLGRLLQVMQGKTAADDVENAVGEGQRVDVAAVPRHVVERPVGRKPARLRKHRLGRVEADGATYAAREGCDDGAGPHATSRVTSSARGLAASTRRSSAAWLCREGEAANCWAWRVN